MSRIKRWVWALTVPFVAVVLAWTGHASGIVQSAYNLIENAGTPLTMRTVLNCGGAITCSDDAVNKRTTISASSGAGGTVTSVTCGTGLSGGTFTTSGTCALTANQTVRSFGASFDGGGSALTSGKTVYVTVPFGCTITGYNITTDTGTASFDVWKIATGTAIPTVTNSILTGGFLAIASGTALHSASTALYTTTTVTANDIVGVHLQAVSAATELSLVIPCNAT